MARSHHPIADSALRLLVESADGVLDLPKRAAAQLENELKALWERQELVAAVQELVTFACFLDKEKHAPMAAKALLDVVATAIPALEKHKASVQAVDSLRGAARQIAETEATTARQVAMKPPAGKAGTQGVGLGRSRPPRVKPR